MTEPKHVARVSVPTSRWMPTSQSGGSSGKGDERRRAWRACDGGFAVCFAQASGWQTARHRESRGPPPGEFKTPIFEVVLRRITIRGSIVGTRKDLAEAISFAAEGKVRSHIHSAQLESINGIFADLKKGTVDGRMVVMP
jgi:hypothetical protein